MLTSEQKQEAAKIGGEWGRQEAALLIEDIENGHSKGWKDWAMGQYCGDLPHDATPSEDRTEEQDAERDDYERILDKAARMAFVAAGEKWSKESEIAALVEGSGGLVLLFDNGGGCTLIGKDYAHLYDDGAQLAEDVKAWIAADGLIDWDGNDPLARRDVHAEDFVVTVDDLKAADADWFEDMATSGATAAAFVEAYLADGIAKARSAMAESAASGETVHIEDAPGVEYLLAREMEDCSVLSPTQEREYWGEDWRVHLPALVGGAA